MYEVASGLLEVFSAVFQGYCLQYFFGSFLETRIRNRRIGVLAVTALYGVLRLGMGFFLPKGYTSFGVFARLAVILCIVSVTALVFYRVLGKIALFLIVTFMAVGEMSFFLAHMLFELGNQLFRLWDWCLGNGYISSLEFYNFVVSITLIGNQILFCVIGAAVLYFTLRRVVQDYREKEYAVHRTELLFILTPGMTGLMVCTLLRITIDTAENGVPEVLYDRYPSLMVIMPVILLLLLFSVMFGVKLFQDMICWNREKSSRIILEKQVSSLQEHMGEMERVYSGIRGMRHDMKNTISVIMQLAAGKEEGLQVYLEELSRTMDRLEFRFKTGNTVVDTLLNMKYHEAVRKMPKFGMDAKHLMFPQELHIRSYDIGVILGNALDNGIEACRRMSEKDAHAEVFIRLSSLQKGNLLILKVENSFDGWIARKGQDEFPVTGKADKNSHGIGLANIKSTAEKYQGAMDFRVEGKVFILSVMMKNEGNLE